jgi:hypothetical protein
MRRGGSSSGSIGGEGLGAFTLVDMLLVIAVLAVVGVIVVPFIRGLGDRGPMRKNACKSNVASIGKGLAIYLSANRDQFPWLVSDNRWTARTGASQTIPPSTSTTYNVSALLFQLVRDGQAPGVFVCPSTPDTCDPNTKSPLGYNWDFTPFSAGGADRLSYSYQAPRLDSNGIWDSGVSADSNAGLVIVADKTPTCTGGTVGGTARTATFDWKNPGSKDPRAGMSANHTNGEMINLFFADFHVGESVGRADCGINNDNIYSCADSNGSPPWPPIEQGPGSLDITKHRSPDDSFLLGPKR